MGKNGFSALVYFLLVSVVIIFFFDLFASIYVRETYSIPSHPFRLELNPNWNVSEENGKIILSGSGSGLARVSMEKVGKIKIKK